MKQLLLLGTKQFKTSRNMEVHSITACLFVVFLKKGKIAFSFQQNFTVRRPETSSHYI